MKVRLDYDRAGVEVEVADENVAGVVETPCDPATASAAEMVRAALRAPIGMPRLGSIARGRRCACVVIPDVTRPMPSREVLDGVLGEIEDGGVRREEILILIATGLHRPNEGAELVEMVGAEIAGSYRIENHFARDGAAHVRLGATSTGVPICVDRRYVEADLKVLLGLTEPHFMAGFSGGRKLVCPGISSEETINAFHGPRFIEHARSCNCVLAKNPTHLASTEVARIAGVDFTLNVVLNSSREVVGAFAGELEDAFAAAAERARRAGTVELDAAADIVVTSGGGYPLDTTWYQSIKGLVGAIPAVREGGTIILAAGLREGIGSDDFTRLCEGTTDLGVFMRRIQEPGVFLHEQWQLEMFARVARHARIRLYSEGVSRAAQAQLFVEPVDSVEEGLALALAEYGGDTKVLLMPHGPYVLALPRGYGME